MVVDSGISGPTVWLCAAIHGDEVTGTAVIQTLFRKIKKGRLLKGKIFAFPILNPFGFEFAYRQIPFFKEDLNRIFPGEKNGTIGEKLAWLIQDTILKTEPDFVIDLHTDSQNSIAYAILDQFGDSISDTLQKVIEMSKIMKLPFGISTSETEEYDISRSLSGYMVRRKIPSVTLELGGPLFVNNKFEKIGVDALTNFFVHLGMIDDTADFVSDYYPLLENKLHIFNGRIMNQKIGLIKYAVRPGEKINRGQVLARVRNVFGKKLETLTSKKSGILLSHDDQSIAFPGQDLFTIISPLENEEPK